MWGLVSKLDSCHLVGPNQNIPSNRAVTLSFRVDKAGPLIRLIADLPGVGIDRRSSAAE